MPSSWGTQQQIDNSQEWRHLYQLAAVVVHIGDALSGHFATYRRGHHTTTSKYVYSYAFHIIILSDSVNI